MADPAHEVEAPQYAGFWRRFLAYVIDTILIWLAMSIIASLLGIPLVNETQHIIPTDREIIFALIGVLLTWLYFSLMESSNKQGTLGKMLIGIIVTDEQGRKVTFARATGRHFSKIISGILLMIGYLMAGWTKRKQALHDIIAKTLVISK